jgi:hypothetical protein
MPTATASTSSENTLLASGAITTASTSVLVTATTIPVTPASTAEPGSSTAETTTLMEETGNMTAVTTNTISAGAISATFGSTLPPLAITRTANNPTTGIHTTFS